MPLWVRCRERRHSDDAPDQDAADRRRRNIHAVARNGDCATDRRKANRDKRKSRDKLKVTRQAALARPRISPRLSAAARPDRLESSEQALSRARTIRTALRVLPAVLRLRRPASIWMGVSRNLSRPVERRQLRSVLDPDSDRNGLELRTIAGERRHAAVTPRCGAAPCRCAALRRARASTSPASKKSRRRCGQSSRSPRPWRGCRADR